MSAPFEARYHGRCRTCEESIRPGDTVRHDNEDFVVHDDCADAAPVERRVVVCDRCHLTKPCDCEDAP